jgi:hypothetical protein
MGKGGQNPEAHINNANKLKKISFQELSKHRTIDDGELLVFPAFLPSLSLFVLFFFLQLG